MGSATLCHSLPYASRNSTTSYCALGTALGADDGEPLGTVLCTDDGTILGTNDGEPLGPDHVVKNGKLLGTALGTALGTY